MDSSVLALPAVAILAATYFVFDAAKTGVIALRAGPAPTGVVSRAFCRTLMGAGMGYMLIAAL